MADHPIIPSNFKKFIGTPVQELIVPIIPVSAKLSPDSKISPEMLGKIPGRYNAQEGHWAGWAWHKNRATEPQLERWEGWQATTGPIAVGKILGETIVIDFDSDDPGYVSAGRAIAERRFGLPPVVRCRDGSVRIQLFYRLKPHTPPIAKRRVAYELNGVKHLTEVLGRGQQTVIEGPHAKGKMHYWESLSLIEGYDQMSEVTIDQTDAFMSELAELLEVCEYTRITVPLPTASNHAAAVSIDDLSSPHVAKDMDLLARAIKAIDINSPLLADYDRWLSLLRAMWAGCAGNQQFYLDHILPWLQGNPANKEEEMEAKLISFTSSQVGAAEVYDWAASGEIYHRALITQADEVHSAYLYPHEVDELQGTYIPAMPGQRVIVVSWSNEGEDIWHYEMPVIAWRIDGGDAQPIGPEGQIGEQDNADWLMLIPGTERVVKPHDKVFDALADALESIQIGAKRSAQRRSRGAKTPEVLS